jgi:hypothetical protein
MKKNHQEKFSFAGPRLRQKSLSAKLSNLLKEITTKEMGNSLAVTDHNYYIYTLLLHFAEQNRF